MDYWCCGQRFASWELLHEHRELLGVSHEGDDVMEMERAP